MRADAVEGRLTAARGGIGGRFTETGRVKAQRFESVERQNAAFWEGRVLRRQRLRSIIMESYCENGIL